MTETEGDELQITYTEDENGFISEVSEKQPQPPEIQIHLPHIHEPREQTEVDPLSK